jgi:AraC-like DNA-binding protein
MIEEYIDRIVFLETDGVDAVYAQREQELQRMPYEMERILLRFVAEGKPKELIDFCLRTLAQSPELRIPIGRTSKNKIRQLKYNAVSGIAIVCRAAMIGGAPEIECYARSDSAIMRIDETDNELTILKILIQTTIDYATLVQQTKSTLQHPQTVRKCVQYIASHTHENITLEQLADGSEYSKEYIAKLFRKHMGMSISDYIQKVRIDEAKELLRQGKSCGEVACILNYTSQSYFIRQFKKQTGITPKLYRNLLISDSITDTTSPASNI